MICYRQFVLSSNISYGQDPHGIRKFTALTSLESLGLSSHNHRRITIFQVIIMIIALHEFLDILKHELVHDLLRG
jgi:hypothetical protein